MKETFPDFVRVQRLAQLNLGWAGSGDLVIKRYFESGSETRQAVLAVNRNFFDTLFNLQGVGGYISTAWDIFVKTVCPKPVVGLPGGLRLGFSSYCLLPP